MNVTSAIHGKKYYRIRLFEENGKSTNFEHEYSYCHYTDFLLAKKICGEILSYKLAMPRYDYCIIESVDSFKITREKS